MVAADGSPDVGIDVVFADIVRTACEDGARVGSSSNNNNNNNDEAAECRKMKVAMGNGGYVVCLYASFIHHFN